MGETTALTRRSFPGPLRDWLGLHPFSQVYVVTSVKTPVQRGSQEKQRVGCSPPTRTAGPLADRPAGRYLRSQIDEQRKETP